MDKYDKSRTTDGTKDVGVEICREKKKRVRHLGRNTVEMYWINPWNIEDSWKELGITDKHSKSKLEVGDSRSKPKSCKLHIIRGDYIT